MNSFRVILFAAAVIAGILLVPEMAAAKCGGTPNIRGTALVIDGRKVAAVDMTKDLFDQTPIWDRFALESAEANIPAEKFVFATLACYPEMNESTGSVMWQEAVWVTTTDHFEQALSRLSGLQEAIRASSGHYATSYSGLPALPVLKGVSWTLTATATGWASTFRHISNSFVTCHLAVGDSELLASGQVLGQVLCINTNPRRTL